MGLSKDFFTQFRDGEEYANMFVSMEVLHYVKQNYINEVDFRLNSIKQVNTKHKEDELLCELYKKQSKVNKDVREREQELNHNNK